VSNKESLDEIRARIARAEAQESERLQNHPAKQELQGWRRRRDEEARREEEMREQERQRARSDRQEAQEAAMKSELRRSYLHEGGTEEGFEAAWPGLREQELARRTLERTEQARRQTEANYRETF
jgi:hypothetical protein